MFWNQMKPGHVMPPVFVCTIVAVVLSIYAGLHVAPLLQLDVPYGSRALGDAARGTAHAWTFSALTGLLVICYARTVLVDPGGVSRENSRTLIRWEDRWESKELKMCGGRRYCKWCNVYKPDRTHHCRVCGRCVLKMDHHCPWIMTCIGFRNHKFFFLLIFYAALDCIFVVATMSESVRNAVIEETPASNRFFLVLGVTLSAIMGILCMGLFGFHMHLMLRGITTIEFCEKTIGERPLAFGKGTSYDHGFYANVCAVLGPYPPFWLLPFSPPAGDGMKWQIAAPTCRSNENAADPEWTGGVAVAR